MAISVNIPDEITEYHEKILFGLSLRQLGFSGLAVGIALGSAFICTRLLSLPIQISGYIIMFCVVPPLALGFIRLDGMPFEQYFLLWWAHYIDKNILVYENNLIIDDPYFASANMDTTAIPTDTKQSGLKFHLHKNNENERSVPPNAVFQKSSKRRKQNTTVSEYPEFYVCTKKIRAAAHKRAKATIKAARKECRTAQQREKAAA